MMNNNELVKYIDESELSDENLFEKKKAISREGVVTPQNLLYFAKCILASLAVIYVLSGLSELFNPGSSIFEACKITIPSIATLVIGYYFGTTK